MSSIPNTRASRLYVSGTPLDEGGALSENLRNLIPQSQLVVGESRKVTMRYLMQCENFPDEKDIYFLDNIKPADLKELKDKLKNLSSGIVILLSDSGMPVLFDPGKEILDFCRDHRFEIHSVPGPTSWATACALSGFEPPFYIQGFLSQKAEKRNLELIILKSMKCPVVILETPYRYESLLKDILKVFGAGHLIFLGWELGKASEFLFTGTIQQLVEVSKAKSLTKGEFVVVLK